MTTMITEVYDALKEAGASEQKAQAAASTLAEHTERFREIDRRFDQVEAKIDARFDTLDAKIDHVKEDLENKIDHVADKIVIRLGSLLVIGLGILAILMKIL